MLKSIFKPQAKALPTSINSDEDIQEDIILQERPLICLIDLDENTVEALQSKGFNCTEASLGTPIQVPNVKNGQYHLCLPNQELPANVHEYDIIIIDLSDCEPVDFEANDHIHLGTKGPKQVYFVCEYPQTIFDPRPLVSYHLAEAIEEIQTKESIIIVFSSKRENIDYHPVALIPHGFNRGEIATFDNYSWCHGLPSTQNKVGHQTSIVSDFTGTIIGDVLEKYNQHFFYEITFQHPTVWNQTEGVRTLDERFIPLIVNSSNEILSFIVAEELSTLFVFPQLENKTSFLLDLLQHCLPRIRPAIFPFNTEFAWVNGEAYRLPNEAELLEEKKNIERKYKQELLTIEQQIAQNRAEYQFLHELLTESSDKLVKAVEMYLQWLGFDNVVNCDEVYTGQNEEDLQVIMGDGLLVIEVKGIGGTSKDNECSQISKIRYRRSKERQKVDVSALYIVNHQRYQPPANRTNPPFSKQQVEDALSDERGLLTTYELFKLFFAINEGFITKPDARKSLQTWGLVTFVPSTCVFLGTPKEIHRGGTVVILEIENTIIKVGDELLVSDNGRYRRIKVIGLQDNGVDVDSFRKGEAGIKLSDKVNSKSQIWLPSTSDNKNMPATTDH